MGSPISFVVNILIDRTMLAILLCCGRMWASAPTGNPSVSCVGVDAHIDPFSSRMIIWMWSGIITYFSISGTFRIYFSTILP